MKKTSKILVFIIIVLIICLCIMGYQLYKSKNELNNNQSNTSTNSVNNSKSNNIQASNTQINNTSSNNTAVNQTNNSIENNNTTNTSSQQQNKNQNTNQEKTVIKELTPSGFPGSSLHKVVLYSNKDVYVITYDGNGFADNNIKSKELIAKNVSEIKKSTDDETYGEIFVKGGEKVNTDYGWIHFE